MLVPIDNTIRCQTLKDVQNAGRTLINTYEAASILAIKEQTLYKWACYEKGPIQAVRVGRSVKWRVSDIAALIG